jgi:hypothetical protein
LRPEALASLEPWLLFAGDVERDGLGQSSHIASYVNEGLEQCRHEEDDESAWASRPALGISEDASPGNNSVYIPYSPALTNVTLLVTPLPPRIKLISSL